MRICLALLLRTRHKGSSQCGKREAQVVQWRRACSAGLPMGKDAVVQCQDCSLLPIGSTWDWKSKRSRRVDMGTCSFTVLPRRAESCQQGELISSQSFLFCVPPVNPMLCMASTGQVTPIVNLTFLFFKQHDVTSIRVRLRGWLWFKSSFRIC